MKPQNILDSHRLQLLSIRNPSTNLKNHATQVATLNFGDGIFRQSEKCLFGEQSKALSLIVSPFLPSQDFHDPLFPIAATHATWKQA